MFFFSTPAPTTDSSSVPVSAVPDSSAIRSAVIVISSLFLFTGLVIFLVVIVVLTVCIWRRRKPLRRQDLSSSTTENVWTVLRQPIRSQHYVTVSHCASASRFDDQHSHWIWICYTSFLPLTPNNPVRNPGTVPPLPSFFHTRDAKKARNAGFINNFSSCL